MAILWTQIHMAPAIRQAASSADVLLSMRSQRGLSSHASGIPSSTNFMVDRPKPPQKAQGDQIDPLPTHPEKKPDRADHQRNCRKKYIWPRLFTKVITYAEG